MMSLVSFILSKDNFNNTINPLLVDKLGEAKDYLKNNPRVLSSKNITANVIKDVLN